jgi:hypothetical protein
MPRTGQRKNLILHRDLLALKSAAADHFKRSKQTKQGIAYIQRYTSGAGGGTFCEEWGMYDMVWYGEMR